MEKAIQFLCVIVSAATVGVADILIKKDAVNHTNLLSALKSPILLLALFFYSIQIFLFVYVFYKKWDLAIVGPLQTGIYAAIVILFGFLIFNEKATFLQLIGVAVVLAGALLITL